MYTFKYYFYFTQIPEINLLKPGTDLELFFKTRSHSILLEIGIGTRNRVRVKSLV